MVGWGEGGSSWVLGVLQMICGKFWSFGKGEGGRARSLLYSVRDEEDLLQELLSLDFRSISLKPECFPLTPPYNIM
jgi:hypothetical protein